MKNIAFIFITSFSLLIIYAALFVEPGKGILDNEFCHEIERRTNALVFGDKKPFDHRAIRPDGVPVVNCDNDTIVWTWKYQVAYNEKRLFFHYSDEGCVKMVVLKKAS